MKKNKENSALTKCKGYIEKLKKIESVKKMINACDEKSRQFPSNIRPPTVTIECSLCSEMGILSDYYFIDEPYNRSRGYFQNPPPKITLCAEQTTNLDYAKMVVIHELTHYYDFLQSWDLSECKMLACRAAKYGECLGVFFNESCIRKFATISTQIVYPKEGSKCVQEMFNECINCPHPLDS